jgi:hypothetical protein
VYLKYAIVSEQFIVPRLEECASAQVTQDGGNKLPAKQFDSNFLLFVCRLGRAPWQLMNVTLKLLKDPMSLYPSSVFPAVCRTSGFCFVHKTKPKRNYHCMLPAIFVKYSCFKK